MKYNKIIDPIVKGLLKFLDKDSGYTLNIHQDIRSENLAFQHISFDVEDNFKFPNNSMWITGRNLIDYDPKVIELILNPELQYIDVGAGIGEFIPRLVRTFDSRLIHKPIIIEPADYELMLDMLDYSKRFLNERALSDRVNELIDRINIILNSNKVTLINKSLENAVKEQELLGIADVIIDNAGASHYANDFKYIWDLEKKLLKPNGILLSEVVKSSGVYYPNSS
ncbi:MAG: hypothetical protein Q8N99_00025 [Nanoarchaeota archaeon]|nr:hypothetical protein [Nanoarchaeota archaeon]